MPVELRLAQKNYLSGCATFLIAGIVLIFPAPFIFGGTYAILALPFYNLVCLSPQTTSMASALLASPTSFENYELFLSNNGCDEVDTEKRQKLKATLNSAAGNPYAGLGAFWGNDPISRLGENITALMAREFVEGAEFCGAQMLLILESNVLLKAVYYFLYTCAIVVAIQVVNSSTHYLASEVIRSWHRATRRKS